MKEEITTKKVKGYYRFYFGKRDITWLWMDFFSGLSMEQESKCVKLFFRSKRIRKALNLI